MNQIEHIIEPNRLLLVWRGQTGNSPQRRTVAEIIRPAGNAPATLRYLDQSSDFLQARSEGFIGYPAFPFKQIEHTVGVLDSFVRRLPPRKRDDFADYLRQHRIPEREQFSDMALLGYTNAKLPSDGFEIYPDWADARPPFEVVIEVAGFRYQSAVKSDDLYIGDPVTIKAEPTNSHDHQAVAIFLGGSKIGYVARALAPSFIVWMRKGYSVNAVVERINGKPERPLIYLYVTVR